MSYKKTRLLLRTVLLFTTLCSVAQNNTPDIHSWAPTPSMGWNSWNDVVVDIRWYVGNLK